MSDLAIKMIEAKALGNQELIHCIREKITALDAMTFALSKWYPSIPSAKKVTAVLTINSGVYALPFSQGPIYVSGIKVADGFTVFSGNNSDVFKAYVNSGNSFVSPDDDRIRTEWSVVSGSAISFDAVYGQSITSLSIASPNIVPSGVSTSATVTSPIDFYDKPSCLSNVQVEKILRKIDEICSCGCGDEVVSDAMSKYMNLEV
jgi:hypothetical protein